LGGFARSVDVKESTPPKRVELESLRLEAFPLDFISDEENVMTPRDQFLRHADGRWNVTPAVPRGESKSSHLKPHSRVSAAAGSGWAAKVVFISRSFR
jgi:hypothetical protein